MSGGGVELWNEFVAAGVRESRRLDELLGGLPIEDSPALRAPLAEAAERAGSDHAAEERAHVALWDEFVDAVGGDAHAAPLPETAECASAWAGADRDALGSVAAMFAIESAQPAISETKRDGLVRFYGFEPDSAATRYFDVHATRDVEHAAEGRAELAARASDADAPRLGAEAERVLRANWALLDGVERALGA